MKHLINRLIIAAFLVAASVATPSAFAAGNAPQPPICNRACWGARAASTSYMSALTRAIVHHTAGNEFNTTSYEASKANVRAIQNAHIANGWGDIGYHFLVDKFGNIFEGRVGSMTGLPRGTHDATNTNSFGFNCMGYFHPSVNNIPTAAMMNSLYAVIAWRMPAAWRPYGSPGVYGPLGINVGYVDGHRRVKATACPGDHIFNPYMGTNMNAGTIRAEINNRILNGGTPSSPAPWMGKMRPDVNGDGKDDIVSFVRGTGGTQHGDVYAALSNGSAFGGGAKWQEFFGVGGEVTMTGDFNGDAKSDLITFVRGTGGTSQGDVHVALSNGSSFLGGSLWHDYFCIFGEIPAVGDFNGDGKDDIATFVRGTNTAGAVQGDVIVALSTGTGFGAGVKWHEFFCIYDELPQVGDFNGDNKDDIVCFVRGTSAAGAVQGDVHVALSNGTSFNGGGGKWHEFFCIYDEVPSIGDFNGDAKDDIISFVRGAGTAGAVQGDVHVALSSGAGFNGGGGKWHEFFCIDNELPGVGDFNGDGKDDIITFVRGTGGTNQGDVIVAQSNGAGFLGGGLWNDFFCIGGEIPGPAMFQP